MATKMTSISQNLQNEFEVQSSGYLQCYCEVAKTQDRRIFVSEEPEHPFSVAIAQITENILTSL